MNISSASAVNPLPSRTSPSAAPYRRSPLSVEISGSQPVSSSSAGAQIMGDNAASPPPPPSPASTESNDMSSQPSPSVMCQNDTLFDSWQSAQGAHTESNTDADALPDIIVAQTNTFQLPEEVYIFSYEEPGMKARLEEFKTLVTVLPGAVDHYMIGPNVRTIVHAYELHTSDQSSEVLMRRGVDLLLDCVFRLGKPKTEALKVKSEFVMTVPCGGIISDPQTCGRMDAAVLVPLELQGFSSTYITAIGPQMSCVPSGRAYLAAIIGFAIEYKLDYPSAVQNQIGMDLIIAARHRRYLGFTQDVYAGVVTKDYFYLWSATQLPSGELLLTKYAESPIYLKSLQGFLRFYATLVNIYRNVKQIPPHVTPTDVSNTPWRSDPRDGPKRKRKRTHTGSRTPSPAVLKTPGHSASASPASGSGSKRSGLGNNLVHDVLRIATPVPRYPLDLRKLVSYDLDSDMDAQLLEDYRSV